MSKLITAKVLSERKYGDKDKVKIVVPSRVPTEIYDNDGVDSTTNEDYTQDAMVACNNNLAKDDLVWITYLDEAKTQPVIVSPYWGKTESDNFNENPGGQDPSDPTTDLLECGVTLADLAVVIVNYGEQSGSGYGAKIKKLNKDVKKMIPDSQYAAVSPMDGKSIGILQWTGGKNSGHRAVKVYKAIWNMTNKKQGTGNLSDDNKTIAKVMSSSAGKDGQWEIASRGTCGGKKIEGGFASEIKTLTKKGMKDNACILYSLDILNQYGSSNFDTLVKIYKSNKNLKSFYQASLNTYKGYTPRRSAVYHNIKMMQDAGWLKGKAGNLENVFNNTDTSNEKTGWVFPISDTGGNFIIDQKWNYKNGIRLARKDKKNEGKKAISMYTGTVKKVEVVGSSYTVGVELRTKTDAKHYVEYCSLNDKSVKEGDGINKNDTIGTLKSNGLLLKVHANKSKKSKYVNPENYIGSNATIGSGGFGGNPDKFIWYYQWTDGYYYHHNYGSAIGNNSQAACGIFSLAMMWTNFSGDHNSYTPPKICNGKGTGIAQKWGAIARDGNLNGQGGGVATATNKHKKTLRCTAKLYHSGLSVKKVKNVLNKGGALLCRIGGGTLGYSGHFLNITGMTKNGKVILADPGRTSTAYYKYKDAGGKGTAKGKSHGENTGWLSQVTYYYTFYPYKG